MELTDEIIEKYTVDPGSDLANDTSGDSFEVDMKGLTEEYSDIAAWLYCPDTKINYPVMKGKSNQTYLHHLPDGSYNRGGSLFIDEKCNADFSSQNTIIYGHNMRYAGTMFADLVKYKDPDFYKTHTCMYLYTVDHVYQLNLIAGSVIEDNSDIYNSTVSQSTVNAIVANSTFQSNVPVPEDQLITLSTCSYEFENARFVVLASMEIIK